MIAQFGTPTYYKTPRSACEVPMQLMIPVSFGFDISASSQSLRDSSACVSDARIRSRSRCDERNMSEPLVRICSSSEDGACNAIPRGRVFGVSTST